MAFVLDASIAAVWAFADEVSSLADLALERLHTETAYVPHLWWYEIRNILVSNERTRRISLAESVFFLQMLKQYPIRIDWSENEELNLQLARQFRLSFYDAAYLAVAKRNRLQLVTLDSALIKAAPICGVSLLA
jgi:predicted nucleic acid-binding protein